MPIFCVKSVKIYTGQKNLHEYTRGARDKYEVWSQNYWGLKECLLCSYLQFWCFVCHHAKLKAWTTTTLVAQCSSYVPAMTLWNRRTLPAIKSRLSLLLGWTNPLLLEAWCSVQWWQNRDKRQLLTRSSWFNCALRDDEAVCWVSIGYCEALAVGNWWYLVSRGHLCLYILHKVEIWKGVTHAWQTDWQLWKIELLSSL